MKKTVKNLLLSSLIALAANFGTGCSNGGSDGALAVLPEQPPIETPAEKPESRPENEPQNSDNCSVELHAPYLWNAEYNGTTSVLQLKEFYGGASFTFGTLDASGYTYAEVSYSDMPNARLTADLMYADESYSRVYLQPNAEKVHIRLSESKKKKITGIKFTGMYYEGNNPTSVKILGIKFIKEKPSDDFTLAKDKISGNFDGALTGMELSKKMAIGWNASRLATCPHYNELDAQYMKFGDQEEYDAKIGSKVLGTSAVGLASEHSILPPESKAHIKAGHDYGLKTLRVNATWFPHIIDKNYTIDPHWMARVKEVVDWVIADGYYVILNDHHSVYKYMISPIPYGTGYNINQADKAESERFLKAIWKQIAEYFNGSYDEHLIFETLNEPRKSCSPQENENGEYWPFQLQPEDCKELTAILNEYNQIIVDTIRASGGNNAKRFILIPTYATDRNTLFGCGFKLPKDSANSKLMIALHWYPFLEYPIASEYTAEIKNSIISTFEKLYESYTSKGTPINFTEFMVPNLGAEGKKYSKSTRLECLKDFCKYAGLYKISATLWDDGMVHGVINRTAPYNQTEGDGFISALIAEWENGWNQNPSQSLAEIFEQNKFSAVSVLDSPVQIKQWGDYPVKLAIDSTKLVELRAGSIIKLAFGGEGFKNFCFSKYKSWESIRITGSVYSKTADYSDLPNFGYLENSPLYIKCSAQDAAALKRGFSIVGMNLNITGIDIIF